MNERSYYYPVSRYRNLLTQSYVENAVKNGEPGFATYKEAAKELYQSNPDDCDCAVCVKKDGKWLRLFDNGRQMQEVYNDKN